MSFWQAPGVGDRQGSLVCCSPWSCKESDTTEWLNWRCGKDPDAGKDWRQKKKWAAEDGMVRQHHRLNGREFEWTLGDSQGVWCAVVHGVTKSQAITLMPQGLYTNWSLGYKALASILDGWLFFFKSGISSNFTFSEKAFLIIVAKIATTVPWPGTWLSLT